MLNSKVKKQKLTWKHHTEIQPVQLPKCLDFDNTSQSWMFDNL